MKELEKFSSLLEKMNAFKKGKTENIIKIGRKNTFHIIISDKLTNMSKSQKEEVERKIVNFLNLAMKCPFFSISKFKERFTNLKIVFDNSEKSISCYNARSSKDNELHISNNMSLEHELFHISSDKKSDEVVNVGFAYKNNTQSLGFGINEGYTEYLNEKYFEHHMPGYYDYFMLVAKKVSDLFGEDVINNIYFNGSIYDLINIIAEKSSLEMAKQFINDMDEAVEAYYDFAKSDNKERYQQYFNKITAAYGFIDRLEKNISNNGSLKK